MVEDVFRCGDRICVVVRMIVPFLGEYHNGYVSVLKENYGRDYNDFTDQVDTDELTFSGTLGHLDSRIAKDAWFLGFDSAHYWNDRRPLSKTFESVRKRTQELARELSAKGI